MRGRVTGRIVRVVPQLPSGTVTFLFTDIEGSTRRWESEAVAMRAQLARHDAILRGAVEAHGGHVLKELEEAVRIQGLPNDQRLADDGGTSE